MEEIDVSLSLKVIKDLSFLPVDEKSNKEIEEYFSKKPFKSVKIYENRHINKERK